ncbi:MAG: hypothetical protein WCL70_11605 [Paludibacter sp.]
MKPLLLTLLLVIMTLFSSFGQENTAIPQRTPEQEATKQTEKIQQELNLSPEQTKQIYEINLRYARERQISNKRSEAMERMKNKNAEIQQVLSQEQNEKLQTKRYERTIPDQTKDTRVQPSVNPSAFRTNSDLRSNPTTVRIQGDAPVRSSFRTSTATSGGQTNQQPQAVKRTTQTDQSSQPRISNPPSSVRSHLSPPTLTPQRTEPTPSGSRRR